VRKINSAADRRNSRRGIVVDGPETWFQNSSWNTGSARGHFIEVYRGMGLRLAELKADREKRGEPSGAPDMLMQDTGTDNPGPYVEKAIENILDKLRHCPPKSQDTTMNTVAFALNRKLAGNWPGLSEHDLKARFMDACRTLSDAPSNKGKWTPKHFEDKWQHAKRDAATQPDPWPPPTYKPRESTLDLGKRILREAEPLDGTLGETYFRKTRGVDPTAAEGYLFFHSAAPCSELGNGETMAAIVAAFRTSPDGDLIAVHVLYVGANGSKPALGVRKRTFGHWSGTGAALYLMPVGKCTGVAEGIEKALACHNATELPVIAAGGKEAMKAMAIPEGVEALIIFADRGAEREARALATRALKAGVKAKICYPPEEGKDWDECTPEGILAMTLGARQPEIEIVEEGELPPGVYIDTGEPLEAPEWLVKGMVLRKGNGLIIGQRGAGKTAIAIALATGIASGLPFFGRKVEGPCGVIYFAAEGVGQIRQRMRAAKMALGIEREIPFACIETPRFKLSNIEDERPAFIERCNEVAAHLKKRFGVETCLLIIDTAIKAYDIEDENDNAEIARICKSLEDIGRETGCFAFGTVHAGKNMAAGARGASAWTDNVDIALFVSGDRDEVKGTCENRALSQTKNREGFEGPISSFDLTFVALGRDKDSEPFGAMAIQTNDSPVTAGKKKPPTAAEIIFENAFKEAAIRHPARIRVGEHDLAGVQEDDFREVFYEKYSPGEEDTDKTRDAKRKAWKRCLQSVTLLARFPRETRSGVMWFWDCKEQREAWNAKARNERERKAWEARQQPEF
jgi:hypothetical protein